MQGQVVQHVAQRLRPFGVGLAEQRLRPRLVPGRIEAARRVGLLRRDAPAGQHARERAHVGLGVAAGPARAFGAQRVQLEHFARQVLVQAGHARARAVARRRPRRALHHAGVGPGRLHVVEVAQHRRMGGRSEQQRLERPGDVGPDRIALERTDQAARAALGERDREVIGPEQLQTLGERTPGRDRGADARARIGHDGLAVMAGEQLLGGAAGRRIARGQSTFDFSRHQREPAAGVEQRLAARCIGRPDLRQQPGLRIGADVVERGFAEAKAMRRDGGGEGWGKRGHGGYRVDESSLAARRQGGMSRASRKVARVSPRSGRPAWPCRPQGDGKGGGAVGPALRRVQ